MVAISGGRAVFPWQRGQDICDVRRSEDGDHDIYAGTLKERARAVKMERVIVKRSQERHYFVDGIDLFEHCA